MVIDWNCFAISSFTLADVIFLLGFFSYLFKIIFQLNEIKSSLQINDKMEIYITLWKIIVKWFSKTPNLYF